MPYTQIISLMIALILVAGAPVAHKPVFSIAVLLIIWTAKALVWAGLVLWLSDRARTAQAFSVLFERLQWASLLPLAADFYLLDVKTQLALIPGASGFPTLTEMIGLGLFFVYLIIMWSSSWWALHSKGLAESSLAEEVLPKLRLLLPALLPYAILATAGDLLGLIPSAQIQQLRESAWAQILFFALFLVLLVFFVPPMVRVMWGCVPVPAGSLRNHIENFLNRTGIRCREILIWPLAGGRSCTAAVLGLVPRFRYILITECLAENLTPDEIEAVISHEAAHLRRRHLIWYVLFLGVYSLILYRIFDPLWTWLLSRRIFLEMLTHLQDMPHALTSFLAVFPFGLLLVLYFRFLMGYFMRHFERQADLSVFDAQGHPWNLITALEKVGLLAGGIRTRPSWHHFSIAQRSDFLVKVHRNPGLRKTFENTLLKRKWAFLGTALLFILIPSFLPLQSWKNLANENVTQLFFEQVMKRGEQGPEWYLVLGQLLMKKGENGKALKAFENALALAPEDPEVLNSMAWFYATSDDPAYLRPEEALQYAIEAARGSPAPHILDTLAESFFINGYVDRAIALETEALKKKPPNPEYYKKQLERFREALGSRPDSSGKPASGSDTPDRESAEP
jgi:Zn-dependent protease with chaperone function